MLLLNTNFSFAIRCYFKCQTWRVSMTKTVIKGSIDNNGH